MWNAVAQRGGFAIMSIAIIATSALARQTSSEPGPVHPESPTGFPMETRWMLIGALLLVIGCICYVFFRYLRRRRAEKLAQIDAQRTGALPAETPECNGGQRE